MTTHSQATTLEENRIIAWGTDRSRMVTVGSLIQCLEAPERYETVVGLRYAQDGALIGVLVSTGSKEVPPGHILQWQDPLPWPVLIAVSSPESRTIQ